MHFRNTQFGKVLASSVAALAATTSLYAIPKAPCDKPADVCCEEAVKPGPFGFAYPWDLGLSCPRDFYIHVDGLAFQAKQDGMEFSILDSDAASSSNTLSQGRIRGFSDNNDEWDYNPGVRVGIGFVMEHDAWNCDFQWTWLNITDYRHVGAVPFGGSILPMWLVGDDTPATFQGNRKAVGKWHADYNVIDLSLGKAYHVSRYLVLNPHFGLRTGWIDQHFAVRYVGSSEIFTIQHADNDFWGIGSRIGVDSDWILGKGWCLFANLAASMLFGKFEVDQNLTFPTASGGYGFDTDYDFYQNTPNMEIVVGLGWARYFDKNKYRVGLRAAYEFHEWWDMFNLRRFWSGAPNFDNDVVSRGNLTLNGFSLRLNLDI